MPLDYDKVRNWPIPSVTHDITARDTILYALGIGVADSNPVAPDDLKFVYEEGLVAMPMMAVTLAPGPFWMQDPESGIAWQKILHGEQMLTVHQPLPPECTVYSENSVDEIYDKGADKGAVMYLTRKLFDQANGSLLMTVRSSAFMRGNGGFGGKTEGAPQPHPVPTDRQPDLVLDLATRPEQAVLYRLSGDYNPLHIDPAVARSGGFDKPILHGLCSYGIVGRAVLKLLCDNAPERLKRLDVRFASPAYPGETIRTEIWRQGDGCAAFRAKVVERDVVIISNGFAEFTA